MKSAKQKVVTINVDEDQLTFIEENAKKKGVGTEEYVLDSALNGAGKKKRYRDKQIQSELVQLTQDNKDLQKLLVTEAPVADLIKQSQRIEGRILKLCQY